MQIQQTNFTIAEIRDMMRAKKLVVNSEYQRSPGVWPNNAKSYFIDTILSNFPFPKIYFWENIDRRTKEIKREIVDGQQRISTIMAFLADEFRLTNAAENYSGHYFSTLNEEDQIRFLSHSISIDNILNSDKGEIVEMFRRINSHTSPLNPAEKRHSEFHGEFKWSINRLADEFSPSLVDFGVITGKQAIRMYDADVITELMELQINGIKNREPRSLTKLYKDNDRVFLNKELFENHLRESLVWAFTKCGHLKGRFIFKGYAFYSLVGALLARKWGLPNTQGQDRPDEDELVAVGSFAENDDIAVEQIEMLAAAHELAEFDGPFGEYVQATDQTTHRVRQRRTRIRYVYRALSNSL